MDAFQPRVYAAGTSVRASALYASDHFQDGSRLDLAVSNPSGARVFLYTQRSRGDFDEPVDCPSLASLSGIAAADLEGDGVDALLVVSEKEGVVGLSRFSTSGQLEFPVLVPTAARLVTASAADLDHNGIDEIISGEQADKEFQLCVYRFNPLEWEWVYGYRPDTESSPNAVFGRPRRSQSGPVD